MSQKKEVLIFTDLDGSLLNNETFKFDEIKNFLLKCLNDGIKLIPTSSKTDLEIEQFINESPNNKIFFIFHKPMNNNYYFQQRYKICFSDKNKLHFYLFC